MLPERFFDAAAWRFFLAYFQARGASVAVSLMAAAGQSLLALPMIPLVRLAFDRAIPRGDIGLLIAIGLGLATLRIFAGLAAVLARSRVVGLKSAAVLEIRRDLLLNLYQRPLLSHVRAETQPFMAHVVVDVERLDAMVDSALGSALPAALTGLVLGGALLYLNAALVVVGVVMLPLVWMVGRFTAGRMRANFRAYHLAYDAFLKGVRFVLATFTLTRARAAEGAETDRQTATLTTLRVAARHLAVDNARVGQVQSAVVAVVGVVILVAGGVAVTRHALTIGGLLAFFAAAALAGGQVERLIAALPTVMEGSAALTRLHAYFIGAGPPIYAGSRRIDWAGRIALEDVDFSYGEGLVLRAVSLDISPGQRIGIVGPNGTGKTTILNLMLGLYRPVAGRLTADGIAFDDLDVPALRRMIGVVPQHPVFFEGSVLENISYGAFDLSRADVEAAATRIGATRLLGRLPGGLDARLGESGLMLSGGERQMIAILRAVAPRPRLLVLDEPTNHLDDRAIRDLIAALAEGADRPGIVLISHDPAVVSGLDAVYRIEEGRLAPAVIQSTGRITGELA